MSILFMWIGILFVVTVLLIISSLCVHCIVEKIIESRYNTFKNLWIANLGDIHRFCDYEFRQVGLMAREIMEAMQKGTGLDADRFRNLLREKEGKRDK